MTKRWMLAQGARGWAGLALAAAMMASLGGPAGAAGGGGGGEMPSAPSQSAPSYDPAEEYRQGLAALQAGQLADAKRRFDHVLAVAPRDANANYLAGAARTGLKDLKGAVRYFEKALKYDDNLILAHQDYGVTLAALGQKDKAQAELDALKAKAAACGDGCAQAADLKSAIAAIGAQLGGGPQSRLDRGLLERGLLKRGGARSSLLFASDQSGDQAYLAAVALINDHRYEEAIASLHRAERAFGPHPDILTYLGFANRKLKRYAGAEAYYRQALAIAPHHRGALEYYGELMVERGDLVGARQNLALLDQSCAFGCYEAEELRRWIASGHGLSS